MKSMPSLESARTEAIWALFEFLLRTCEWMTMDWMAMLKLCPLANMDFMGLRSAESYITCVHCRCKFSIADRVDEAEARRCMLTLMMFASAGVLKASSNDSRQISIGHSFRQLVIPSN